MQYLVTLQLGDGVVKAPAKECRKHVRVLSDFEVFTVLLASPSLQYRRILACLENPEEVGLLNFKYGLELRHKLGIKEPP
jgi:hypothetical protein